MNTKPKFIVMLGVGDDRKPRAACFDIIDDDQVRKAAAQMNFRVGIPKTSQAAAFVSKLPDGKLFESGQSLIPLCSEATFYKLNELLTFDYAWMSFGAVAGRPTDADEAIRKTADLLWDAIKPGSTVLAFYHIEGEFGWGAAIVLSASKNGERLDLRWRDWPNFKVFTVDRRSVALLRPELSA
jgi:hypothetical protein